MFSDKQLLYLVGGGAVLVLLAGWYARRKVGQAVEAVVPHVNPVDERNVFNRLHNWGWQAITGQEHGGIGIWLADKINPPGKWAD